MAKKRASGEGTIFQRQSDNKWVARYNGKVFYANTQTEALDKLNQYKADLAAGYADMQNPTVEKYGEQFLSVKKIAIKQTSYERLESTFYCHIKPRIGNVKMQDLTGEHFSNKVMKAMMADGLSYSSVKKVYDCMNAICKYAVIKRDLKFNPLDAIELPSKANFDTNDDTEGSFCAFNASERVKFIEECRKTYSTGKPVYTNAQGFILILNTGLRIGELLALKWSSIDFQKRQFVVKHNLTRVKDENGKKTLKVTSYPKNSKTRIIQLNNTAIKLLEELKTWQTENGINSEFVICSLNGLVVSPNSYKRTFEAICRNAGIVLQKSHKVHVLRHTFASLLFEKGVNVKVVSEILGHSSIKITMDIYVHLLQEQNLQAVRVLDDIDDI